MQQQAFVNTAYAVRGVDGRNAPSHRGEGLGPEEPFLVIEEAQDAEGTWWPKRQELIEIPHGPEPLNRLMRVKTPGDALDLCGLWGFLGEPVPVLVEGRVRQGEPVRQWLREAALLRACAAFAEAPQRLAEHVHFPATGGAAYVFTGRASPALLKGDEEYLSGAWLGEEYVRAVAVQPQDPGEAIRRFLAAVVNERLSYVRAAVAVREGFKPAWRAEALLGHIWLQFAFWLWGLERYAVCGDCGQVFSHSRALRLPQPICPGCSQRRRWKAYMERGGRSQSKQLRLNTVDLG